MNDPACKLRFLADRAVCKLADRYGDDPFRKEVDGVMLPAVTHWFYGFSIPAEHFPFDRTRSFNAADIAKLEDVGAQARILVDSVAALPFVSAKDISRESANCEKAFANARERAAQNSSAYTGYLCLVDRLRPGVAAAIIAFCG